MAILELEPGTVISSEESAKKDRSKNPLKEIMSTSYERRGRGRFRRRIRRIPSFTSSIDL